MHNIDRALAYAKQRGVEIPSVEALMSKKRAELVKDCVLLGYTPKDKTTKEKLVELIVLATLLPQLTPAQRRRITSRRDDQRTLRDRKARKIARHIRRRRWLGLA